MAEPRVTITLGRSGQKVVKRTGPVSQGGHSEPLPLSGRKRSVKERLGTNRANALSSNKRQRGYEMRSDTNSGRLDGRVGQSDLRVKLMRKRQARSDEEEYRRMEQRERLERTSHPPMQVDLMPRGREIRETTYYRQVPRTKSEAEFLSRQPPRESNSSWPANGSRYRSPDRILSTPRNFSPAPRNVDGTRPPPIRSIDASRNGRYLSADYMNPSRPVAPAAVTMKDHLGYARSIAQPTHPSSGMQKTTYMVQRPAPAAMEQPTVAGLLESLDLKKYSILFQAEEVDMTALKQMEDNDLKELGIPMGPRRKILRALQPARVKRQPP